MPPVITPFYLDKALYVAVLGFILPIINRKFGLGLDATEVVTALGPLVAFIIGHKYSATKKAVAMIASTSDAVEEFKTP